MAAACKTKTPSASPNRRRENAFQWSNGYNTITFSFIPLHPQLSLASLFFLMPSLTYKPSFLSRTYKTIFLYMPILSLSIALLMMHAPAAPAARTSSTFSGVIPPMAYTGSFVFSVTCLRKSSPLPGSPFLQSVS